MALARGKHFIWINAALLSSNFKPGRELWWIRRVSIFKRQNANFTWMLATWERRELGEGAASERRRRAAPRAGWCTAPGRWKMELVTDSIMSLVLLKYMITWGGEMSVYFTTFHRSMASTQTLMKASRASARLEFSVLSFRGQLHVMGKSWSYAKKCMFSTSHLSTAILERRPTVQCWSAPCKHFPLGYKK